MPQFAPKKKYLNAEMCGLSAAYIAGELQANAEGRGEAHHLWTCPEDFDRKAARLYHPEEVTAIRAVLVKMGALSA